MKKKINNYWMYNKYSVVNAILNPKRKIIEILIEKKLEIFYRELLQRYNVHKKKINIKITNKNIILNKIGKFAKYQGVALLVEKLNFYNYDNLREKIHGKKLILLIDQLNDPMNLGSILRVSYAFGVDGIIILEHSMTEENGFVASIASGSLDKIDIFKVNNLVNTMNYLKKYNWWIFGLESKLLPNCIPLNKSRTNVEKKALVIGSENKGLRNLVRKNCDTLYRIPTKNNDLNSINVVQATSIALYELASDI